MNRVIDPEERLRARYRRESQRRAINDAARADIKRGLPRDTTIAKHGLSPTAYGQLWIHVHGRNSG